MSDLHSNVAATWLWRFFTVIWWGLLGILAIAVWLTVAAPLINLSGAEVELPARVVADSAALHVAAPSLGIAAARLSDLRGNLIMPAGSRPSLIAPALTIIAMMVLALWGIGQLRAVLKELSIGHTFAPANAVRLRRLAWIIMIAEPLRALMNYTAFSYVASHFVADGLQFTRHWDVNVGTLICAVVIVAIAEVFRAGTRLDDDQSLTI